MEWYWWYLWIVIFILILLPLWRERRQEDIRRIVKKHKQKGVTKMGELIKNYVGKECIVYISNGSSAVTGVISKIEEGWIEVETKTGNELLNTDYISRVQEYPRNKNGKKKSVVV